MARIQVRKKNTGEVGSIEDWDFDPNQFERLDTQKPQNIDQPKQRSLLASVLPILGGAGGAVAGGVLGPAGVIGGGAFGAAGGETLAQLLSGEKANIGAVGREGALGAIPLGKILGLGGRIASKPLTQALPKTLMNRLFKEPLKRETLASVKAGKSLGEQALDRGIKGLNDEQIYAKAVTKLNEFEDVLRFKLGNSSQAVSLKSIKDEVNPLIKKLTDAGNLNAVNTIATRLTNLEAAHGKQIPVALANNVKRTLYGEVRKDYGKLASEEKEGIKTIARGLRENIAKKVPGSNEINQELKFWGRLVDSLEEKMTNEQRKKIFGLIDTLFAGGGMLGGGPLGAILGVAGKKTLESTGFQSNLSNILNLAGKSKKVATGGNVLAQLLGQSGTRLGNSLIGVFGEPRLPITRGDEMVSREFPQVNQPYNNTQQNQSYPNQRNFPPESIVSQKSIQQPILSPKGEWRWDEQAQDWVPNTQTQTGQDGIPTKEQLQQSAVQDLQTTGGKNITKYKTLFDLLYPKEKDDLSPQQQKDAINAKSGLRNLDLMEERLNKDSSVLVKASLPGSIGARDYVRWGKEVADVYTRLRTGAALNENEIKFYNSQLPKLLDYNNPQNIAAALKIFRDLFNEFATGQRGSTNSTSISESEEF